MPLRVCTFKIDERIWEKVVERAKALGYASTSEYIRALIIRDLRINENTPENPPAEKIKTREVEIRI